MREHVLGVRLAREETPEGARVVWRFAFSRGRHHKHGPLKLGQSELKRFRRRRTVSLRQEEVLRPVTICIAHFSVQTVQCSIPIFWVKFQENEKDVFVRDFRLSGESSAVD